MIYRMWPVLSAPGAGGIYAQTSILPLNPDRLTAYQHTITATGGFESLRLDFSGTLSEAIYWAGQLMAGIVVTAPDATVAWEGYLAGVEYTVGLRARAVALDEMANRVRVRYTTVNGVSGVTATASDTNSQARYGIKDLVETLPETTATGAEQRRGVVLAKRARPKMRPTSQVASGQVGGVQISLIGAGWYSALDWVVNSNTDTSSAVTTTQVGTLLTGYNAVNAFLATSTRITASGISDTQYIGADTTYRAAIEKLLAQGNGTNRYAWGVYEDRMFWAAPWAGATPTTVTYRGTFGSQARIYGLLGNVVMPWAVRPDAIYEESDLLDVSVLSDAPDAAARHYLERVTFSVAPDGYSVDMEPEATDALDAQLARFSSGLTA